MTQTQHQEAEKTLNASSANNKCQRVLYNSVVFWHATSTSAFDLLFKMEKENHFFAY